MTLFGLVKMIGQKKPEFQKIMEKKKPAFEGVPASFDASKFAKVFNEEAVRKGEMPSANCHGNARGMAKLAALMANKGQGLSNTSGDDNKSSLMSEDTWIKMHASEKVAVDGAMPGGIFMVFLSR